jgi:hypothetical protein
VPTGNSDRNLPDRIVPRTGVGANNKRGDRKDRPGVPDIGLAIGAVRLNLWLSGRRRMERPWVDRLGRTLAFLWLMMVPLVRWLHLPN